MGFLKNLAKGFVRSGVNQVGRDGGRVISNQVYGDKHSIPIRNVGQSQYSDSKTILTNTIPSQNRGDFKYNFFSGKMSMYFFTLLGCIVLYPISWLYFLLGFFKYKNKKTITLVGYETKAVSVTDRRFKTGNRIDTYMVKAKKEFLANDEEIQLNKTKAWIYFAIFISCWVVIPGLLVLLDKIHL